MQKQVFPKVSPHHGPGSLSVSPSPPSLGGIALSVAGRSAVGFRSDEHTELQFNYLTRGLGSNGPHGGGAKGGLDT